MYSLDILPFSFSDLEPFIDTHTMGLHYEKHQKNYLKKLNQILMKNNFDFSYPMEELYNHISDFPMEDQSNILFYLGGVVNHNLYWKSITPKYKEMPNVKLMKQIQNTFGSFWQMKERMKKEALALKGSGYVFLVSTSDDNLKIQIMPNQDSPLLFKDTLLFCIDLWEHAYYINYENEKERYIDSILEIANFHYANSFFPLK